MSVYRTIGPLVFCSSAAGGGGGAWLPAGPSAWPSLAWGEHSIVFHGMSSGGRFAGWVLTSGWCAWFSQCAGMWGWGRAMGAAGSLVLGWVFVRALFLARCSLLLCCCLLPGGGFACARCRGAAGAVGGGRFLGVGVGGGGLEVVPEFCYLGGALSAGVAAVWLQSRAAGVHGADSSSCFPFSPAAGCPFWPEVG